MRDRETERDTQRDRETYRQTIVKKLDLARKIRSSQ